MRSAWFETLVGTALIALGVQAQAAYVSGLDGTSVSSTFETGVVTSLPSGWSVFSGAARVFDLTSPPGNGSVIGTTPYDNYGVQYTTATAVASSTTYSLSFDMGFVAANPGGSANYSFTLGTWNGTAFSPLGTAQSGSISRTGNLFQGVVSGSATQVVTTGSVVPGTGVLALRWAQTGTSGQSDYFGFDNVRLDAVAAPIPEASEWSMMLAGLGLVGWMSRRRRTRTSSRS